ncbi:hypothetical protein XELAEV_18042491mg [Xenopus laevis]|uniref:C2H2-type domain-containing protein n=1 Tax=Xenopus laevis TaxID=8355 RepID=A0A974C464_XENLA|nr:hypothetical protein XELAEV_18042491mg [Xenopus laevis]
MEKEQVTNAVLNYALEIIHLLTGEDYNFVKEHVLNSNNIWVSKVHDKKQNLSLEHTVISCKNDWNGEHRLVSQMILELAQKIIQELTNQVLLKHDDIAVFFSVEEWEYMESHKEQYKDMAAMDNQDQCSDVVYNYSIPSPIEPESDGYCDEENQESKPFDIITEDYIPAHILEEHSITVCEIKEEPFDIDCTQEPMVTENIHTGDFLLMNGDRDMEEGNVPEENGSIKTHKKYKAKSCQCKVCGKWFCDKSRLARHHKTHTGERPFACNVCGKTFARKSNVSVHQRIHTEEKPYTCMECGRKFTNNSHLVSHKVVHTREKPFTCLKCGKGFTRNSSLVKHSGIHAEQKPYVCNQCGKSYCQYANLVVHLRLHSGEKPYVCRHCGQSFICKASMERHQRTHTEGKPYHCVHCPKAFTDNSSLNRHKKTHKNELISSLYSEEYHSIN